MLQGFALTLQRCSLRRYLLTYTATSLAGFSSTTTRTVHVDVCPEGSEPGDDSDGDGWPDCGPQHPVRLLPNRVLRQLTCWGPTDMTVDTTIEPSTNMTAVVANINILTWGSYVYAVHRFGSGVGTASFVDGAAPASSPRYHGDVLITERGGSSADGWGYGSHVIPVIPGTGAFEASLCGQSTGATTTSLITVQILGCVQRACCHPSLWCVRARSHTMYARSRLQVLDPTPWRGLTSSPQRHPLQRA